MKIGERKFIVSENEKHPPFITWHVTDYYKGEKVSGGPIIATFYNEENAKEYANFKNKQHE